VALALPGRAWSAPPVEGWEIVHNPPPDMCTAIARDDDKLQFALAAEGRDFFLKMWAPDFPEEDRSYEATLDFKGVAGGPVVAVGQSGLMAISLGRGELATALIKASDVTITVDGHSHSASLAGAAAALDGVARCAKQPTLAEAPEKPPLPIPDAGDWTLYETLPFGDERACMAHLDGKEVDTMLEHDKKGVLILTGGNPMWAFQPRDVAMRLSIDGGPDISLPGRLEGHGVTMKIEDPKLVDQLRGAHKLDWIFPQGSLRSDVTGLGAALDATERCRRG
jgi:hypothetical protein